MYWYRSRLPVAVIIAGGILFTFCLGACKPGIKETTYFDVRAYFTGAVAGLKKQDPIVQKTVTHNGVSETKKVKIADWEAELDLFTSSDINKPALKNSYTVVSDGDFLIYKAKYPELTMREMIIKKDKGKIKWVLIYNGTKNMLYQSNEKLSYFPDSLYLIEKVQKVKLLGANSYKIQGVINR